MPKTVTSPKKRVESWPVMRIVRDKRIMHGQPIIKGTRIPASLIFDYLADGYSIKDILDQFPHLTPEDVNAALRYGSNALQR